MDFPPAEGRGLRLLRRLRRRKTPRHFDRTNYVRKYDLIDVKNVFTSIGFEMYPSHPASRKRSLSPRMAWAVRARMGIEPVCGSDFISRITLRPSMPGR